MNKYVNKNSLKSQRIFVIDVTVFTDVNAVLYSADIVPLLLIVLVKLQRQQQKITRGLAESNSS